MIQLNIALLVTCLVLAGCAGTSVLQKQHAAQSPQPRVQVYLLLGQSNMAGRGVVSGEYEGEQHPRVLMLDKENRWVTARHPMHFDKPKVIGVGPGLRFGAAMAEAYPGDTIALVPCAVGGTAISRWMPGAYDSETVTHPYDDAVARTTEAMKKGEVMGAIWLQGESDSNTEEAIQSYLDKLLVVITNFRKTTHNQRLPFVAGELGAFRPQYRQFNRQLVKLPSKVPYTAVVSSAGFRHKGDTTHFDSPSENAYGLRFAKGMLQLQARKAAR